MHICRVRNRSSPGRPKRGENHEELEQDDESKEQGDEPADGVISKGVTRRGSAKMSKTMIKACAIFPFGLPNQWKSTFILLPAECRLDHVKEELSVASKALMSRGEGILWSMTIFARSDLHDPYMILHHDESWERLVGSARSSSKALYEGQLLKLEITVQFQPTFWHVFWANAAMVFFFSALVIVIFLFFLALTSR